MLMVRLRWNNNKTLLIKLEMQYDIQIAAEIVISTS